MTALMPVHPTSLVLLLGYHAWCRGCEDCPSPINRESREESSHE